VVEVVIGYGGAKAEEVAIDLRTFLKDKGINAYCVSPKCNDVPQGTPIPEVKARIRQKMKDYHIIVFICHEGTPRSKPAVDEIEFIINEELTAKTIIFSNCDHCIPSRAKNMWHPMHFVSEKHEESFCRLLNMIYGSYILLYPSSESKKE
jgi:hypothetical protein